MTSFAQTNLAVYRIRYLLGLLQPLECRNAISPTRAAWNDSWDAQHGHMDVCSSTHMHAALLALHAIVFGMCGAATHAYLLETLFPGQLSRSRDCTA